MPNYTSEDIEQARIIVNKLLREGINERIPQEESVISFDLEKDLSRFAIQLQYFDEVNHNIPAVNIAGEDDDQKEMVPILLDFKNPPFPGRNMLYFRDYPEWRYFLYEWMRRMSEGYETISTSQAKEVVRNRASKFLATRIAFNRSIGSNGSNPTNAAPTINIPPPGGGAPMSTHGCNFTVSTNTGGLSVRWSGAYLISWNHFSGPTSPVTSVMQSGTYLFGVKGGPYTTVAYDSDDVVNLPGSPTIHLNF